MAINQSIKQKSKRRLRIILGQIKGIEKMIEKEKYCIEIIGQIMATKEALSKIEDLILENHLNTHLVEGIKNNGKNKKKAIQEILKVYKLSKRK